MERLINAKVDSGRLAIVWLGHGGFALKPHGGDIIVVDPYLSDSMNAQGTKPRLQSIPIKPRDIRLDYLFLTHDHADSADPETIMPMYQANGDLRIVCPPSCCRLLTKIGVPMNQIDSVTAGQHVEFPNFSAHAVPAYHTDDSVGYIFEFDSKDASPAEVSLYHTGHTGFDMSLASAVAEYGPDILIVPIGGNDGNLETADAAQLAALIAPEEVIPINYGMFGNQNGDPEEFASLLAEAKRLEDSITVVAMRHNTCHVFCPASTAPGRYAHKKARAEKAWQARRGHEHQDGLCGPNTGLNRTRAGIR